MFTTLAENALKHVCLNRNSRRRKPNQVASEPAEILEDRSLLAGNVLASLNGSNLVVNGDNKDNYVEIVPSAAGPGITVVGLADGNGQLTTVNGQLSQTFPGVPFVDGNLKVNMKGGHDAVVTNVPVNGNVVAKMGGGDDWYDHDGGLVGGNLKINTGAGDDVALVSDNQIHGNAVVNLGKGDDISSIDGNAFAKNLSVNMGAGADTLGMSNVGLNLVFGSLTLNGGKGFDSFEHPFAVNPASKNFEFEL